MQQSQRNIASYEHASPDLLWYFNNRRTLDQARAEVQFNRNWNALRSEGKLVVLATRRRAA